MKRFSILLVAILALGVSPLIAAERTTPVVDSLNQGAEDLVIVLSSGVVATDVLDVLASTASQTTSQKAYRFVVVENLSATAKLYCSPNRSNVDTLNLSIGNVINPGKWKYWVLKPRQSFYVISDGTLATGTTIYVTAGR